MSAILAKISAEPVLVVAVVQSIITLGVSFGLQLTAEQIGGILLVTNAILAIVARGRVTPVS